MSNWWIPLCRIGSNLEDHTRKRVSRMEKETYALKAGFGEHGEDRYDEIKKSAGGVLKN